MRTPSRLAAADRLIQARGGALVTCHTFLDAYSHILLAHCLVRVEGVVRLAPLSIALIHAVHPTHQCADGSAAIPVCSLALQKRQQASPTTKRLLYTAFAVAEPAPVVFGCIPKRKPGHDSRTFSQ